MIKKIIYKLLSEHSPELCQKITIVLMSKTPSKYLKIFIQPIGYKMCWRNCAIILTKANYYKISVYITDMFVWLQDMNWPGSHEIFEYLKEIPKNDLKKYFEEALKIAISAKDEDWIYYLSLFYQKTDLIESDFSDKTIISEMKKISNNY